LHSHIKIIITRIDHKSRCFSAKKYYSLFFSIFIGVNSFVVGLLCIYIFNSLYAHSLHLITIGVSVEDAQLSQTDGAAGCIGFGQGHSRSLMSVSIESPHVTSY